MAGEHTFEVRATDEAGNTDATPASRSITVDTVAPQTSITSGPSGLTNDSTPTFAFSSSETGSTFECKVDDGSYGSCTSPETTAALADGEHTFQVRATDAAGNTDATPASRSITVDATAPQTTITSGPSGLTNDSTPTFEFSADEAGSTFECAVDGGSYGSCTSPKTLAALTDGAHTFQVRATDEVGNTDATPASRSITVDTVAPQTSITSGPSGLTNDSTPTFEFSSSEAGSTFECKVDDGSFSSCTSPETTAALADGEHTFEVRATDAAGNTDATPATRAITVDATAPLAPSITSKPSDPTSSTSAAFGFTPAESNGTIQCQLDAGSRATCASRTSASYSSLAYGSHTFRVRQVDAAGNVGSEASYTWAIKATTALLYTGGQIANVPNALTLKAAISSSFAACKTGQTVTFTISPNPTGAATAMVETATTDGSGVATKTIASTTGWIEGVYNVVASYAGSGTCFGASDEATLLVATPGQAANGGGWYTHSGAGRVNFGFTVRLVQGTGPGTPNPAVYKGQFLLINNGKWRCKGTLSAYSKSNTSGAAEGECKLEWWDATLNGGLGGWTAAQGDPVNFTINFTDFGSGGKNSTDTFGIRLVYTPSAGSPAHCRTPRRSRSREVTSRSAKPYRQSAQGERPASEGAPPCIDGPSRAARASACSHRAKQVAACAIAQPQTTRRGPSA